MKRIRRLTFSSLVCLGGMVFCLPASGQPEIPGDDHLISGYSWEISGDHFSYHSSVPSITEGLIARATDGKQLVLKEVDVLGKDITEGPETILPLESKFYRVSW